jgi:hypothetical protein
MRDLQKSKVYKWEQQFVALRDTNPVPFKNIQSIVDYIWKREGLNFPPTVEPLPKQKHAGGDATRLIVRFPEKTFSWVVLHELAHSMTATFDNKSNGHGSLYMGIYIQLLSRYLGLKYSDLVWSAQDAGLKVELNAKPVFID